MLIFNRSHSLNCLYLLEFVCYFTNSLSYYQARAIYFINSDFKSVINRFKIQANCSLAKLISVKCSNYFFPFPDFPLFTGKFLKLPSPFYHKLVSFFALILSVKCSNSFSPFPGFPLFTENLLNLPSPFYHKLPSLFALTISVSANKKVPLIFSHYYYYYYLCVASTHYYSSKYYLK